MSFKNQASPKEPHGGEKILTASIGQCVHVAGTYNFIQVAKQLGYQCRFLGPATPVERLVEEIEAFQPDILGLSYRLTAGTAREIIERVERVLATTAHHPRRVFFAGTPEVVEVARQFSFIDAYFVGGERKGTVVRVLSGDDQSDGQDEIPMTLTDRIAWKRPYPLLRAHFGLPDLTETVEGITRIAEAGIVDVVSIAPDQNSQENFFHPEDQDPSLAGAGGVPLRSAADLRRMHEARLAGNHPLLRIYAGTRDFIKLAQLHVDTIQNAWAAIPVFWFNQMDGRGPLPLQESIKQHLAVMRWHARHSVPVEINDPHHWGLRNSPDALVVADMFLCGIIAKELGIKHFVAQYMFNTPVGVPLPMDLARVLAMDELLHQLVTDDFHVIRQVRTGLASFPLQLDRAKAHLSTATLFQLAVEPDIIHVVSYCEADHAARPAEIVESCNLVEEAISHADVGRKYRADPRVQARKDHLIREARDIVEFIPRLAGTRTQREHPFTSPEVLARLVRFGVFDAPHLKNNSFGRGEIVTRVDDSGCNSWDPTVNQPLKELKRLERLAAQHPRQFLPPGKVNDYTHTTGGARA